MAGRILSQLDIKRQNEIIKNNLGYTLSFIQKKLIEENPDFYLTTQGIDYRIKNNLLDVKEGASNG